MQRRDLIVLVSRAFALLLVTWAAVDITYMPERLFSLFHYISQRSALGSSDFWSGRYVIITLFALLRIGGLFLAAGSFWKGGAKVEALLLPEQSDRAQ